MKHQVYLILLKITQYYLILKSIDVMHINIKWLLPPVVTSGCVPDSQREVGKQGFPNWMLVVEMLVEFVIEGDLCMKDATCQVDSKSLNLIIYNIIQNDLRLLNITQGPVATLTNFPFLLTCLIRLAGRSNGSSSGTTSCPVVPVATSRGARCRTSCGWGLATPAHPCLDAASCSSP